MPTYSYRCRECGHEFELVQRMSEDPITECPSCHKQGAKRQITSANFILKGGGWYSDLYSGGSNKASGSSSSGASGSSASTAAGSAASSSGDSAASSGGSSASSDSGASASSAPATSTTPTTPTK